MSETKAQLAERLVAAWDAMERWKAEALAARNVLHWYRASNTPSVDAEARYASARAANGEE